MSVGSTTYSIAYTSDGVTLAWAIPYYFMAVSDIFVQVNTSGVITTLVYTTDYTITGTPDAYGAYPSGATLNFVAGHVPTAGAVMTFIRQTARLQPDQYIDNSAFPANVMESDLDRLTMITQELAGGMGLFIGLLAGPPTSGTFVQGNWFIQSAPISGGFWGGVCVAGGSPGTWKTFGAIS